MPFDPALLRRVAQLDLSEVQTTFAASLDDDLPYHLSETTGLEYRRLILLLLTTTSAIRLPPCPVDTYWRLHAAHPRFAADTAALAAMAGTAPERLHPPTTPESGLVGEPLRRLYSELFPCGDADLWGWPTTATERRTSTPTLATTLERLPDAHTDHDRVAMLDEALALREDAEPSSPTFTCQIERGCLTTSFGSNRSVPGGPVMTRHHGDGRLAALVEQATGEFVVPTAAIYNYRGPGESSSLHNDPYGTELVLVTLLSGPVEPLHCHPDLADTPLDEIRALSLAHRGHPPGGVPVDVSADPLLMAGQLVPHHRAPSNRSHEVIATALFFGVLAP